MYKFNQYAIRNILVFILIFNTINCEKEENDDYSLLLLSLINLSNDRIGYFDSIEIFNSNSQLFEMNTSRLSEAKIQHKSTLLKNGNVLITGGSSGANRIYSSADIYNNSTNAVERLPDMHFRRNLHSQTILKDGTVLIAGGYCIFGESALDKAEIYDPNLKVFTVVGSMNYSRCSHGASLLADGRVLIVGGYDPKARMARKEMELYDPATKSFTTIGNLVEAREFGIRLLNTNEEIPIIFGGNDGTDDLKSIDVLNSITLEFEKKNQLTVARNSPNVVKFLDGRMLIASGRNGTAFIDTAEIYDPTTNTISLITSKLNNAAIDREPVILNDGRVLLTGGFWGSGKGALNRSEFYDPVQNAFIEGPQLTRSRHGQNATLLNDGNVLITGGRNLATP
ncbi:Kelch repeat-containing protein [Leptospira sp. GIMC2001]|uniref:Kelch repeat-containing protein n=1 Tax=Leptospira sp. GIMC2001 TaxID=1513297 RepID=UPI002349D302|nr:kelch motif-containing protein [Leptospira sp. GIMC2001]WCL50441.1 hypothetical protein O4O04_06370 [Leptospira sp. GIMC2001]